MRIRKTLAFVIAYIAAIAAIAACNSCKTQQRETTTTVKRVDAARYQQVTNENAFKSLIDNIEGIDTIEDNTTLQYDSLGKLLAINRVRFHRFKSSQSHIDTLKSRVISIEKDTANATEDVRSINYPAGQIRGREVTGKTQFSKVMLTGSCVVFVLALLIAAHGFKRKVLR